MNFKKSLIVLASAGLTLFTTQAFAVAAYGLSSNQELVRLATGAPQKAKVIAALSGFTGSDTALIGIDFRVQNNLLYGVGDKGGVYTIDLRSGALTLVNNLSVVPDGTVFGVDFNPAADRLRIISNTGQNLRHNVNSGGTTLTDSPLNTNGTTTTGVVAGAYTNNELTASSGTMLFDITSAGSLQIQSPPNAGSLAAVGTLTVAPAAGTPIAFDIFSKLENGLAKQNFGYALLSNGTEQRFYKINLLTGSAEVQANGTPLPTTIAVTDIALVLTDVTP